jgi:hypothetical protein
MEMAYKRHLRLGGLRWGMDDKLGSKGGTQGGGSFLPGLASNLGPPDLCLRSSWDYGSDLPCFALKDILDL